MYIATPNSGLHPHKITSRILSLGSIICEFGLCYRMCVNIIASVGVDIGFPCTSTHCLSRHLSREIASRHRISRQQTWIHRQMTTNLGT